MADFKTNVDAFKVALKAEGIYLSRGRLVELYLRAKELADAAGKPFCPEAEARNYHSLRFKRELHLESGVR
ncbi:MAG: hypothetical protein FWD15_02330 [Alphaproteobacteria bacterium]|nr:hypothetical protein [Alphaproteobacteria bacterium]